MCNAILTGLAWFFLFFMLAIIVQQLAEVRMLLEDWLKTYREGFVEFSSVEETKDVEEPKESEQEEETNEEASDA